MLVETQEQPILEVHELRTEFDTPGGVVHAVGGVSFSVERGKVLCIVGESGSGKSVTVRSVLGLISPPGRVAGGQAYFHGKDLLSMSKRDLNKIRGDQIAMVFQNPLTSLNPAMTVGDQVGESLIIHRGMGKSEARTEVIKLLRDVGIPSPEQRFSDYPAQFSGGMRQRIMIASALSCRPEILIADEPTTALDVSMQAQILKLLKELQEEIHNALIMITHDLGVVAGIADDVIVMYSGKVVEKAPITEIYSNPRHPYTQGLIDTVKALEDTKIDLVPIPGAPAIPKGEQLGCSFAPRCRYALNECRHVSPELEMIGPDHIVACHFHASLEATDV